MAFEKACRVSARSVLAASIVSILSASNLPALAPVDRRNDYEQWIERFSLDEGPLGDDWIDSTFSPGKRISAGAGGTIVVENCDDAGPGSLRQAFLDAVDGTLIDASGLTDCPESKITLLTGELSTSADVALKGPGKELLEITADDSSRVIAGKYLEISDVTITHGSSYRAGGCVFAAKDLVVENAWIRKCVVNGSDPTTPDAVGGALYAGGDLIFRSSGIWDSTAKTDFAAGSAYGGGLYAKGDVDVHFGILAGNGAVSDSGNASGGGIFAIGTAQVYGSVIETNGTATGSGESSGAGIRALDRASVASSFLSRNSATCGQGSSHGGGIAAPTSYVFASTFSKNKARGECTNCVVSGGAIDSPQLTQIAYSSFVFNHTSGYAGWPHQRMAGGAIAVLGSAQAPQMSEVSNSTFYGNYANYLAGGTAFAYGGAIAAKRPITISSSTIAMNTATQLGGGLAFAVPNGSSAPTLISVILANNGAESGGADVATLGNPAAPYVIAGSHNLVKVSGNGVTLPADTLISDPRLVLLSPTNGWGNYVLKLATDSPAIDHGIATSQFDQRLCWYARDSGNAPDIGAFEVQFDRLDNIFGHGFETALPVPCPVMPP